MKVLIIDPMHESIHSLLNAYSIAYDYLPEITPSEVLALLPTYEGLFLRSKMKLNGELLAQAQRLKFIARAGAGVDQIDEQAMKQLGITLFNAPEGNRDAVGEHTLAMLLCLMNKVHLADREVRQKQWRREENRGYELKGRTVALIGYGNMGKATARRLQGFDCEVLAYDIRNVRSNVDARLTHMEEIWEKADVVSFHIPLDAKNKNLITDQYLNSFCKPIWLVNMARGEIMTLGVIRRAVESGRVIGAALDVLENEKLDTLTAEQAEHFDFLAGSDRVLFTPHVGGWTFESYERINQVLVGKLAEHFGWKKQPVLL